MTVLPIVTPHALSGVTRPVVTPEATGPSFLHTCRWPGCESLTGDTYCEPHDEMAFCIANDEDDR